MAVEAVRCDAASHPPVLSSASRGRATSSTSSWPRSRVRQRHPDATFALPEVSFGLIPGAGGTVSIPALEWGRVDEIARA